MGKKMLSALVCFILVMAMIPAASYAMGNGAGAARVELQVHRNAGLTLERLKLQLMVELANREIARLVKRAQATPWNDVPELLAKVDAIASRVFAFAQSIGAEVACEYVEYYIDGQYVLIDPLRVVRL